MSRANRTLAIYRQQNVSGAEDWQPAEMSHGWMMTSDFYTQSAILALVSIAEEFSLSRLVELAEERSPAHRLVELLWESELGRSADTWSQRDTLLARYFGITAGSFPLRAALVGFIDARNAIAHGLGSLTRKQQQHQSKISARLAQAGITMERHALMLQPTNVENCAMVVTEYVLWLDAEA